MFKKSKGLLNIKNSIAFAKNSYSTVTIAVVLAIVIVINLMLQQVAGTSLQFDVSDTNIYDISDISVQLVDSLDSEITFTAIGQKEYIDDIIVNFIDKYASLSDKITVEWIDPILHPTAVDTYNASSNTLVVTCAATGKSVNVLFSDILYTDEYSYYMTGTAETEFDGDGLITSAISQAISTREYKVYNVTGHGESSFGATISDLMTKNSVVVEELNLLTTEVIPEDCELLTIYAPQTDITTDEKDVLLNYMAAGGDVILMLSETDQETPNLEAVINEYGLMTEDGYIADMERAYQGNGYYIIPEISVYGDMANDITSNSALIIYTKGFSEIELDRDTVSLSKFMTTSTNGIAVSDAGEVNGQFILGAVATETISEATEAEDGTTTDEVETRFTIYGSANIIDESIISTFVSLDNATLFMNSVMANFDGATNISIESKVITEQYNVVDDASLYNALFIVIVPVLVLTGGFMVWFRRRKQ
ncbi:MAG: Gldg family protein [Eubacteriales bacterium]